MTATTIKGKNREEILSILESGEIAMAEIRLDLCPISEEDIEEIFASTDVPLIATCRFDADPAAERKILRAVASGAAFADVEAEAPAKSLKAVRSACDEWGTRLIVSFHDFRGTPPAGKLEGMLRKALQDGADFVKIVTTAASEREPRA